MRHKLGILTLVMLLLIFSSQNILAQENTPDLKKEIEELKQGQKALQEDLKIIMDLLTQSNTPRLQPPPPMGNVRDVEFELGNNPEKGSESAPLVIIEFSDYQCSFCAKHVKETYPDIYKKYINAGKLRYVIFDNPLPFHNMASKAAEAAHCAAEQGSFWEMHDRMMSNPELVNELNDIATSLGLDMQKFESCMDGKKYIGKVDANVSLAKKLNILAAPGFVIAASNPDNTQKVKGISFILGAMPFTQFQKEIDQALASLSK
jgi:protein-disulfide isomerase